MPRTPAAFAAFLFGAVTACTVQASPSPFLPANTSTTPAGSVLPDPFQLEGAAVSGHSTQVCIYDAATKKSEWIGVGTISGAIQVLSYDAAHDTAVIVVNGAQKSLSLRKSSVASTGRAIVPMALPPTQAQAVSFQQPAPPPPQAPPAAVAEPVPQTPAQVEAAKQEREARMLVSDLLEIGMQQRKAYEEAQKKAQEAAAAAKSGPNG